MLVYLITNKVNGKRYVGQTTRTLNKRWNSHLTASRRGGKCAISKAINKYGEEKFSIEILRVCKSRKELSKFETLLIKKLGTLSPQGYNLTTGGESSIPTEETKKKQSKAKLGMHTSTSTEIKPNQRLSPKTEFKAGYRASPKTEFKKGQTPWNKGISMYVGSDNPFFGKKHSVSSKKKMRKAKLGKPAPWKSGWHHGTSYAYGPKKCRCEVCIEWKRNNR
jgi:group I intron endonuclease